MIEPGVARLWGKLTGVTAKLYGCNVATGSWCYDDDGGDHTFLKVPDPATQPWKWVTALVAAASAHEVYIADECMGTPTRPWTPDQPLAHHYICRVSLDKQQWAGWGDTPEAALAAAIEKMADEFEEVRHAR